MITCPKCFIRVRVLEGHCCFQRGVPTPVNTSTSKSNVLVIDQTEDRIISPEARVRRAKLHEQLRAGENPFVAVTGLTPEVMQSNKERAALRQREQLQHEIDAETEEQARIARLEHEWKEGAPRVNDPSLRFTLCNVDSPEAKAMGFGPVAEGLHCSFCGALISNEIEATRGRGKTKINFVERLVKVNGKTEIVKEIKAAQHKTVACPNCVHKIKPVLDKEGEVIRQGVMIPNTD